MSSMLGDTASDVSPVLEALLLPASARSRNDFDESLFVLQDSKMCGSKVSTCQHFSVMKLNTG